MAASVRMSMVPSALVALSAVGVLGCDAPSCEDGTRGCACYGNDTCNAGMDCIDGVCVDAPDGGAPDGGVPDGDVSDGGEDGGDAGPRDADASGLPCEAGVTDPEACPPGELCLGGGTCGHLPSVCPQSPGDYEGYHAVCDGGDVVTCFGRFTRNEGGLVYVYHAFSGERQRCGTAERCLEYQMASRTDDGRSCGPTLEWAECVPSGAETCELVPNAGCTGYDGLPSRCDGDTALRCQPLDGSDEYVRPFVGTMVPEDCAEAGRVCRDETGRAECAHPDAVLCTESYFRCEGSVLRSCAPERWEHVEDCSAEGGTCRAGCGGVGAYCVQAGATPCDPSSFERRCTATGLMTCGSGSCYTDDSPCPPSGRLGPDGTMRWVPTRCVDSTDEGVTCVDAAAEDCDPVVDANHCDGDVARNCVGYYRDVDCATFSRTCAMNGTGRAVCPLPGAAPCDPSSYSATCDADVLNFCCGPYVCLAEGFEDRLDCSTLSFMECRCGTDPGSPDVCDCVDMYGG